MNLKSLSNENLNRNLVELSKRDLAIHLSHEEFENLKRVRDLNSHQTAHGNGGANFSETVATSVDFFLTKKDPLKSKTKAVAPKLATKNVNAPQGSNSNEKAKTPRTYVSIHVKRAIHQRDGTCRWVDPVTGEICGSSHLAQLDHIIGLEDGGTNDIDNFEIKCAIHNRLKYALENGNSKSK